MEVNGGAGAQGELIDYLGEAEALSADHMVPPIMYQVRFANFKHQAMLALGVGPLHCRCARRIHVSLRLEWAAQRSPDRIRPWRASKALGPRCLGGLLGPPAG